jgi:hypothetical protein
MDHETLGQRAERALRRACATYGLQAQEQRAVDLLRIAASTWFDRPTNVRFPVFLLDGSPFELCLHLPPHNVNQLRFTLEPVAEAPSLLAYWDAARATVERLCSHLGWSYDAIGKLYALARPGQDRPLDENVLSWASWIGGAVAPSGDITLKTYVCLMYAQMRGANMHEILAAAGVGERLRSKLPDDVIRRLGMLAVDLTASGVSRVKLYLLAAPTGPHTAAWLDRIGALTVEYRPGDAARFLELYAPEALAPQSAPFVTTTLHAVGDDWQRLTVTALYEAANRPPDDVLEARTRATIREYGAGESAYDQFGALVGYRSASVMSFQRQRGVPMLTMYGAIPLFDGHGTRQPRFAIDS